MVKTPADLTRKWKDTRKLMNNSWLKAFLKCQQLFPVKYNYEYSTRLD